jgi:carbamate kinase
VPDLRSVAVRDEDLDGRSEEGAQVCPLLADELDADLLLLLTDVPCAYTNFLGPRPARVGLVPAAQARALIQAGHFAAGSMRPKVESAARFARRAGRRAVICDPAGLESALRGESGTTVIPDG